MIKGLTPLTLSLIEVAACLVDTLGSLGSQIPKFSATSELVTNNMTAIMGRMNISRTDIYWAKSAMVCRCSGTGKALTR
jgi:hypothetical protein